MQVVRAWQVVALLVVMMSGYRQSVDCLGEGDRLVNHPQDVLSIRVDTQCVAGRETHLSVWAQGLVRGRQYRYIVHVKTRGAEDAHEQETAFRGAGPTHSWQTILPPLPENRYTIRVSIEDRHPARSDDALLASTIRFLSCFKRESAALDRASREGDQTEYEKSESQSEMKRVDLKSRDSGSAVTSNFPRPANPSWEEEESCSNLYQFILGSWLADAGWEIASSRLDLHGMPRDWGAGNMGGRSSEVWLNRAAGVVLKRLVHFRETFEREVFWLRYWEEAEEDIAPRLLASFTGSAHEAPLLLMTDVGEMLVPGNAPLDWERQVGLLARWVAAGLLARWVAVGYIYAYEYAYEFQ